MQNRIKHYQVTMTSLYEVEDFFHLNKFESITRVYKLYELKRELVDAINENRIYICLWKRF